MVSIHEDSQEILNQWALQHVDKAEPYPVKNDYFTFFASLINGDYEPGA